MSSIKSIPEIIETLEELTATTITLKEKVTLLEVNNSLLRDELLSLRLQLLKVDRDTHKDLLRLQCGSFCHE